MNRFLMTAPKWAARLVIGVLYASLIAVFGVLFLGDTLGEAAVRAVVTGVIFGWLFGGWASRENRAVLEATALDDAAEVREAQRATWRGPVPEDPEIREAAVRLTEHRLQRVAGYRWTVWLLLAMAVAFGVGALVVGPGLLAVSALLLVLVAFSLWQPRRLSRRLVMLRG